MVVFTRQDIILYSLSSAMSIGADWSLQESTVSRYQKLTELTSDS